MNPQSIALYARVSSERQADSATIHSQDLYRHSLPIARIDRASRLRGQPAAGLWLAAQP
jgi:hypothetical protein